MRTVYSDQVIFDECLPVLWKKSIVSPSPFLGQQGYFRSFILLDFKLQEKLDFGFFSILPSIDILNRHCFSFVTPIQMPDWSDYHDDNLWSTAIGTLFSFVFSRPVVSLRDNLIRGMSDEDNAERIALLYPATHARGTNGNSFSRKTVIKKYEEMKELITNLLSLPYNKYAEFMRSMRLINLSHNYLRDDFALSYYLQISAIESVAQLAITRNKVKYKPGRVKEKRWEELSKEYPEVKELNSLYKKARGENHYVSERFVSFIKKYCPVSLWNDLEHPRAEEVELAKEYQHDSSWLLKERSGSLNPKSLSEEQVDKIIKDMYEHRSRFTHQGLNPPHQYPNGPDQYFQVNFIYLEKNDEYYYEELILPNFSMVAYIAKTSIVNYINEISKKNN